MVASIADAFTSVCVLAKPASSGDLATALGFTVYQFSGLLCAVGTLLCNAYSEYFARKGFAGPFEPAVGWSLAFPPYPRGHGAVTTR